MTALAALQSREAVLAAMDEFAALGRSAFLDRYGFGPSKTYMVRHPARDMLCDSKAILGAAFGKQFPERGALRPADFSGGEATVVAKLRSLGFEVVRVGEDWTESEVRATVDSYFAMLGLEARQEQYRKTEFNAALRSELRGRSKAAVELKYQNISAVLHGLDLPFIPGYKPRGHAQLLLRKVVQSYLAEHGAELGRIVDDLEEMKPDPSRSFKAVLVDAPKVETVIRLDDAVPRPRLPRKVDYAARDEVNRRLGRAGEQWTLEFEQRRLHDAGCAELFQRVVWVSDAQGDGAGFDILSCENDARPRFIEVKTTNAGHASSFVITRNELEFSREAGDAFYLYRLFQFRQEPALYILRGDVSQHLHLEPIDYRASFRRLVGDTVR